MASAHRLLDACGLGGRSFKRWCVLPSIVRRSAAYLPAIVLAIIGLTMFAVLVTDGNPFCRCTGVCSCPSQPEPPFPILTLAVLTSAGILAAVTYFHRRFARGRATGGPP